MSPWRSNEHGPGPWLSSLTCFNGRGSCDTCWIWSRGWCCVNGRFTVSSGGHYARDVVGSSTTGCVPHVTSPYHHTLGSFGNFGLEIQTWESTSALMSKSDNQLVEIWNSFGVYVEIIKKLSSLLVVTNLKNSRIFDTKSTIIFMQSKKTTQCKAYQFDVHTFEKEWESIYCIWVHYSMLFTTH